MDALKAAAVSIWAGIIVTGGPGCVAGGIGGAAAGSSFFGVGAAPGAVGGCITGAAIGIGSNAGEIAATTIVAVDLTLALDKSDYTKAYNNKMAQCAQIP